MSAVSKRVRVTAGHVRPHPHTYRWGWRTFTVSVVPLPPGWINEFTNRSGGELFRSQCPALLLQELRSTTHCEDTPTGDGRHAVRNREERHLAPDRETRAQYAESDEYGGVDPASDLVNYVRTYYDLEGFTQLSELDRMTTDKETA